MSEPSIEVSIPSYTSHIGGVDIPGDGWIYTVSARALLEDVFTAVKVKRALDRSTDPAPAELAHPYVVGRCALASDEDSRAAIAAAGAAADTWAAVPLAHRLELGRLFHDALHAQRQRFLDLLVAEGVPIRLARWELTGLLRAFSPQNCAWYGRMMHSEFTDGPRRLLVRRQADGVVCVNPPQNAPAPMAGVAVEALMAGNAVIVRAPRSVALSTMFILRELVVPALAELGAPPGTLNLLCGRPQGVLNDWLLSPEVDDIVYFGGSDDGLAFERECVARGKKPVLELAGNDGLVVWRDADLERVVEAVLEAFYGSAQICMVPNYLVVHPEAAEELLDLIKREIGEVRPGFPDDPRVLLAPVRRSERFFSLLSQTLDGGAELVCGGNRMEADGSASDSGVFIEPTVVRVEGLAGARGFEAVRHETFFPLLPVVVPEPEADEDVLLERVLDFVNANQYGLRNSWWTGSAAVAERVLARVRNGGLLKINDSHIGNPAYLPSLGGTGRTSGVFGEANYPILRTSHLQGVSIATGVRPWDEVFDEL